jgi:succinylglutamate desuccinylase
LLNKEESKKKKRKKKEKKLSTREKIADTQAECLKTSPKYTYNYFSEKHMRAS